jgi:hypothetical protein
MAEISLRPILPDRRLRVGSHIKVRRFGYYHHGIYVGRHHVIHYSGLSTRLTEKGQARIVSTTLEEFAGESTIEMVEYKPPPPTFSRDEIVANAKEKLAESERLAESKRYNVFLNNCEHFATWCMTGKPISKQVWVVVLGGIVSLQIHNWIE